MVHAYSPAKPSPLSRILMLNDSIASPGTLLEDLVEEEEHSPTTATAVFTKPLALNSRAAELRVDMHIGESPLKEKKVESNVNVNPKTRSVDPDVKRFTAKEKGKGKADAMLSVTSTAKHRVTGNVEKENQVKAKGTRTILSSSSSSGSVSSGLGSNPKMKPADGKKVVKSVVKPASVSTSGTTRVGMKLPPGKGGARRVPIDSAEAAPVGPGWRG
jgi:hypothetical protein